MRRYTKDHEWVRPQGDVVTVGISDFAAHELGDITYVELPEVGDEVDAGETLSVVESVKAASDIYAPVAGEIVEVNNAAAENPASLNESPETDGWICKIKMSHPKDLDKLMTAEQYQEHLKKSK